MLSPPNLNVERWTLDVFLLPCIATRSFRKILSKWICLDHPRALPARRAPASGLKLMLAILVIFALLAGYGKWEHFRRSRIETVTIIPAPNVSPSSTPNDD